MYVVDWPMFLGWWGGGGGDHHLVQQQQQQQQQTRQNSNVDLLLVDREREAIEL